jgi:hypothetical protein
LEGFEMNKLSVLAGSVMASLFLISIPAPASGDESLPRPELEGAWQVIVTLRVDAPDCTTAEIVGVGANPFPSFNTFHRGGTMSEFGTRSPPSNRTSGHGVWKRTGYRSFDYRSVFFSFDDTGQLVANMDFRSELKLARNGNRFKGVSRLVRTELGGTELHFCATLSGERISL